MAPLPPEWWVAMVVGDRPVGVVEDMVVVVVMGEGGGEVMEEVMVVGEAAEVAAVVLQR